MVSFVIFYLFLSFLFAGVLVFTILQVFFNFNRFFTYLAGIQVLCYCVHDSPLYAGVIMGGLNLSLLKKRSWNGFPFVPKMSQVVRKPVFGVSDHLQHKLDCTSTIDG